MIPGFFTVSQGIWISVIHSSTCIFKVPIILPEAIYINCLMQSPSHNSSKATVPPP